jgi:hypothetical protein
MGPTDWAGVAGHQRDTADVAALTGDPLLTPFLKYSPGDRPGFGPAVGTFDPEGHNVYKAVLNLVFNMLALNEDLYGWPSLALPAVLLGVLLPPVWSRPERILLVCGAGIFALYFCFMGHGVAFGARYYHVLLPVFSWFTLRACSECGRRSGERAAGALLLIVPFWFLMAGATYWPGRLVSLADYWDVLSRPEELLEDGDPADRPIVLVPPVKVRGFRDLFDSYVTLNGIDPLGAPRTFIRDGPWVHDGSLSRLAPGRPVRLLSARGIRPLLAR